VATRRRRRGNPSLDRFTLSRPASLPVFRDPQLSFLIKRYSGQQESTQVLFLLRLVTENRHRVFDFLSRWKIDFLFADRGGYESVVRITADLVDRLMKLWLRRDRLESRYHYTYFMLNWFGVAAFHDPVVIETLSDLEAVAYNERVDMKTRLDAKETLQGFLQLPLPTLKGRKARPAPEALLVEHEETVKALDGFPVKRARNIVSIRLALKERFPDLNVNDVERIASEGLDERNRYSKVKIAMLVLNARHHKKPGTIGHWLDEANQQRKLSLRLLKEHRKSLSKIPTKS